MAPRARKVKAEKGLIHFSAGITTSQIKEFLTANSIEIISGPLPHETDKNLVTITVPPSAEYLCPDDIYVWLHSGE